MGEATYNEAQLEHIKLQNDVFATNLELTNLEQKEMAISTQLLQMQKGGGMSFWLKPNLHLNRPQTYDVATIIINKCGFLGNGSTVVILLQPFAYIPTIQCV
jgi:hypothetical protein